MPNETVELHEAPGVEELLDPLADRQLALRAVAFEVAGAAAQPDSGRFLAKVGDERTVRLPAGEKSYEVVGISYPGG